MAMLFRRDAARHLRAPALWCVALLAAIAARLAPMPPATAVAAVMGAGALAAWWFAFRSLRDEVDAETIEPMAAAPIRLESWLAQASLAAVAGAAPAWTLAALVAGLPAGAPALTAWLGGLACMVALAAMGACMAVHQQRGMCEKIINAVGFGAASLLAVDMLVASVRQPGAASAARAIAVGAAVCVVAIAWWRLTGGHWPESMLPVDEGARARSGERGFRPLELLTRTPDGWCPVLWRELAWGSGCGAKVTVVTLIAFFMGLLSSGVRELSMGLIDVLYLGAVPGTVLMVSLAAVRTSSERRAGMWVDLAPTPVTPARIVNARVLGTCGAGLLWLIVVLAVCCRTLGPELGTVDSVAAVVYLVLLWIFAGLAGVAGGAAASGWAVIVAALALVSLAGFCVWVVMPAMSGLGSHAGTGALVHASVTLTALAVIALVRAGAVQQVRTRGEED